jgi:hypothetical protein
MQKNISFHQQVVFTQLNVYAALVSFEWFFGVQNPPDLLSSVDDGPQNAPNISANVQNSGLSTANAGCFSSPVSLICAVTPSHK